MKENSRCGRERSKVSGREGKKTERTGERKGGDGLSDITVPRYRSSGGYFPKTLGKKYPHATTEEQKKVMLAVEALEETLNHIGQEGVIEAVIWELNRMHEYGQGRLILSLIKTLDLYTNDNLIRTDPAGRNKEAKKYAKLIYQLMKDAGFEDEHSYPPVDRADEFLKTTGRE